jgi:23S rRNA (guanosine2251-2'-O)-methyltransferase
MNRTKTGTTSDLLIGTRPLLEALNSGREIDKIFIQKGLNSPTFKELWPEIKSREIPYQYVPIEKLNRISRKNHQGVIAFASAVSFSNLSEVITRCYEKGEDPLILVLDRITDVRNFGAICRTAECTGVHAVVIPTRKSAPVNEDALKTSAGALNFLPVCREKNLKETLKMLQDYGIKVVGCTEKSEESVYEADLKGPSCLIMGSEEDGVSPEYLKLCDYRVKLPMRGGDRLIKRFCSYRCPAI